jgi:hypothetical protein
MPLLHEGISVLLQCLLRFWRRWLLLLHLQQAVFFCCIGRAAASNSCGLRPQLTQQCALLGSCIILTQPVQSQLFLLLHLQLRH